MRSNGSKQVFHTKQVFIVFLVTLLFPAVLAAQGATPVKVAVLPFTMNAPANMTGLRDGIQDMLASRLGWKGKVQVIDKSATEQALKGSKTPSSESEAMRIGHAMKVDYVLFGSITAIGQAVSIDAKVAPVQGNAAPQSFYAQAKNMDEVVPRINRLAQDINQKLFGRPAEQADAASSSDGPAVSNKNPELLIPDSMLAGEKVSSLNPNFIEVTPEGTPTSAGFWKSQNFNESIVAMDIGDVDGDKRQELVTASRNKITIYKREANGLRPIATYSATKLDKFIYVSVMDINHDGKEAIVVCNLQKKNAPNETASESVLYGRDVVMEPGSFVLAMVNGKLQPISEPSEYYLNAVRMPSRGKVLLGQKKGTDSTFEPNIFEMQLKGNKITESIPANLPARCNIFNFAKGDLSGDKTDKYVLITDQNNLAVLDGSGTPVSKTTKHFAATSNSIEGKVHDLRYNQVDYYYIPSPVLIHTLNKTGIPEVIVNRTSDYAGYMPEGVKWYDHGEIVSLTIDQMGLSEHWKTRELSGMVTSLRIGDINGDTNPELVISLVMSKDITKIWESKSVIITYDLNVAEQQAEARKGDPALRAQ